MNHGRGREGPQHLRFYVVPLVIHLPRSQLSVWLMYHFYSPLSRYSGSRRNNFHLDGIAVLLIIQGLKVTSNIGKFVSTDFVFYRFDSVFFPVVR